MFIRLKVFLILILLDTLLEVDDGSYRGSFLFLNFCAKPIIFFLATAALPTPTVCVSVFPYLYQLLIYTYYKLVSVYVLGDVR